MSFSGCVVNGACGDEPHVQWERAMLHRHVIGGLIASLEAFAVALLVSIKYKELPILSGSALHRYDLGHRSERTSLLVFQLKL
jgi:hypothetical protein